jgi:hypothetical protein
MTRGTAKWFKLLRMNDVRAGERVLRNGFEIIWHQIRYNRQRHNEERDE